MILLLSKKDSLKYYGEAMYSIYADTGNVVDKFEFITCYLSSHDKTIVTEKLMLTDLIPKIEHPFKQND